MAQVGADPLVIAVRIIETKMAGNLDGSPPEKLARCQQGVPGVLVVGAGVGLFEQRPQLWLKVIFEVFAAFAGVDRETGLHSDIPGEHFGDLLADVDLVRVLGVGQLLAPQSLGDIGAHPPEFVAAVEERFGAGRFG